MEKCGFGLAPQPVWMTSFDARKVRARETRHAPEESSLSDTLCGVR